MKPINKQDQDQDQDQDPFDPTVDSLVQELQEAKRTIADLRTELKSFQDESSSLKVIVELTHEKYTAEVKCDKLERANHYLKMQQDVLEELKIALRMPYLGSYIEWAKELRASYDKYNKE